MAWQILFTHSITGVATIIDGTEFRYVNKDFAEHEAKRLNKVDNPAWNGKFSIIEVGNTTSIQRS